MTSSTHQSGPHILWKGRILPQQPPTHEQATPLSLLDATTANFGLTSAIWLLERPTLQVAPADISTHLQTALSTTLNAYPQWCGYLKAILSADNVSLPPEAEPFPTHAKRYGRVYVHYGTATDPGVEFIEATSTATVDDLYNPVSAKRRPIWNRQEDEQTLTQFVPSTNVVSALAHKEKDADGLDRPIMAVQYTQLACGGLVLAAKIAHPLADIASLTHFVRDWASVSKAMLENTSLPILSPVFEPSRLDECAAGNLNAETADPTIITNAMSLPLHRYDWWAPPAQPPSPFPPDLPLAGNPMPWEEWDTKVPIEQYTIHFTREQIDHLHRSANKNNQELPASISKHDALLAHIWSCIIRARGLEDESKPVHCDLVLGLRPALQLGETSLGSPTMMLNIALLAREVASKNSLSATAKKIRKTISTVNTPHRLASHLHTIAFEKSPQRIWQAFLGKRHILVTSWVRAGLYDSVDFGFGSRVRYADGVVPCLDGCLLIVDGVAPPGSVREEGSGGGKRGWADFGADVTVPLRKEDGERLVRDPMLLPQV